MKQTMLVTTENTVTRTGQRILLAWEHGRNLGHISRLLAIARLVNAHGSEPVFALPPAFMQAPQFNGLPHARFIAPMMRQGTPAQPSRIDSFADILLSFGFADVAVLGQAVRAWVQLFEAVQPCSIVLDYAPAAQLAAQLLGVRAFQITNGFDAPPPDCPVFGIAVRGPYLEQLNARKLEQISTCMAQVGRDVTGSPGPTLADYFNHPTKVYDCIPETDPYGPRDHGLCVGPLLALPDVAIVPWPHNPAKQARRPYLFAYLRDVPNAREWLDALGRTDASTLCVWPDAPDDLVQRYCSSAVRITRQSVNLPQALAQADAVLNYGAITTVCHTLLAGKPQLMVPADIEKILVARKVVQHGAGLMWRQGSGTCADALHQLLNASTLAPAAQAIADKYPIAHRLHKQSLFAQALTGNSQPRKDE